MENCNVKILEKETNKKRALSLSVKMQLLEAVDEGKESKTNICKRFGIPNSTLSTILKSREKISTAFETSKFEGKRKRLRVSNHENLDAALLTWYKQTKGQNLPVSGPILMDKAVALAVELGINFNCNVGWLHRFKQRNNITFKNSSKEKNGLVENTTFEWFSSTLPNILKDFYPSNIFSAAVTGVFYKCLPDKAPKMKGSRCGGGEKSKHRMTILLGCNMDGSEKIPLLVIGKYLKPRCFKNVKSLPLDYTANKNAWMTSNIFTGWLVKLDKYFAGENRQIALIVDNCLAHPYIGLNLRAIKLVFLPPNTTSVLQPCNQGIIQSFKFFYRKCLMQKYLTGISVKEDFQNLSVLDALHLIRTAWNSVSQQTMKNCFTNAKFNLPEGAPHEVFGEQLVVLVENNIDLSAASAGNNNNHNNKELLEIPEAVCVQENPTAAQDFEKIYQLVSVLLDVSSTEFTFNDYIVIDNDLVTAMMLSDSEIVESGKGKVVREEDDDDDSDDSLKLPTAPPNSAEMLDVLKTLRRFLESRQDGAKMYDTLAELEQYVEQEIVFGSKQKKIAQILNSK